MITGANGQLGRELQKLVPEDVALLSFGHRELDVSDRESVNTLVQQHNPDLIINGAAYTAVDKAENESALCFAVNRTGAENVALAARLVKARLIHISTDFVFDGRKSTPYQPADETAPLGTYGTSKLEGERRVAVILPESLIIRTAWLYSTHGNNFVKTMIRLMQDRPELTVVEDQIGTPTWAGGLAQVIWQMIQMPEIQGIYHWTDAGVASWYDFAVAIQEEAIKLGILPREIQIKPISTGEYPTLARRPPYSVLDKTATRKALGRKGSHWRTNLREMLREFGE